MRKHGKLYGGMVSLHEKSIEFILSVLLDSSHTTNGFTYNTSEPKHKRAISRLKVRLCGVRNNRDEKDRQHNLGRGSV